MASPRDNKFLGRKLHASATETGQDLKSSIRRIVTLDNSSGVCHTGGRYTFSQSTQQPFFSGLDSITVLLVEL